MQGQRAREFLLTSLRVSSREIRESFKQIIANPGPGEILFFLRDVVGSGAWIGNTGLKCLHSLAMPSKKIAGNMDDVYAQIIVNSVARGQKVDTKRYLHRDIFKAIYRELEFAHWNSHQYTTPLKFRPCPQVTIVLVSGVLNEIYKTAAFERGVEHLSRNYGQKYFVAKVSGLKGAGHNSKLIEKQLLEYIKANPKQKLWILAYSKGGIDCLHFMKKNPRFSSRHIIGLSTIASPILGSRHVDQHLGLRAINYLRRFSHTKLYRAIDRRRDLLALELQRSLAASYREHWFKRNHRALPKGPFYTSLALEANFTEGHVGMMATKVLFPSWGGNDGVVDTDCARFPDYFRGINLGCLRGHHLVGARSSTYLQEALIEAHGIFLQHLGLLP